MDNTPATDTSALAKSNSRGYLLVLLTAAVLAALVLWQWLDGRSRVDEVRQDFAKRLADNDAMVRESRALAKQNQELTAALQARLATLEAGVAAEQSQQLALEAMYQEFSRTRDERVMAEVEQSITIAAQQLQLAGNVEAALIALNGADARLARAAQPQFLPLRKLIARDIANLTALPVADISGMAVKIESIVAQVDSFAMASERRPKTGTAPPKINNAATTGANTELKSSWWQTLFDDIWGDTQQLIRIERGNRVDPGLLPPTQAYFLRENIKLRLVNARLALLARDGRSFHDDTRQVADWLNRYFDTQPRPVQSAIATMKEFSALDIVQQAPSLNETLTAVRSFKLGRK